MPLALSLGQVADPNARHAFEQIALRWPDPPRIPTVNALPATGALGSVVYLATGATPGIYVFSDGWKKA